MKILCGMALLQLLMAMYAARGGPSAIDASTYYHIAWMLFATAVIVSEIREVRQ